MIVSMDERRSYSFRKGGLNSTFLIRGKDYSFDEYKECPSVRIQEDLDPSVSIHKFIPLRYLLVLLTEKRLFLNHVSLWEDPYENFFLKQKFITPGEEGGSHYVSVENLSKGLYGMSWSMQEETDSMWRIYSPDRLSVRITTTIGSLTEVLCSWGNKWDVWVNKVSYLGEDEIGAFLSKCRTVKNESEFVEKMGESFFIKRTAFEAEKEFRVIVNYAHANNTPSICFKCDPSRLISSFFLDPRLNRYEYEAVRASLLNAGVNENKISQSRLYKFNPKEVVMDYNPTNDF